ncbi:Flagellar motor switch protein FliG [Roseibacterium elongatum DSM 19469]|uniref:Flagellar motor switch protein FliG n=1 Tax=Roseicyclus elongatus DSM 19469 TaxID=1294273 RepID=W8S999_9RHOB|nr:FliG C-terminal domain-containing protein [Roseibacterium elongatum]AHM05556.1 Flagellar motor switch protein FliG [Roseibacterium elongatum DSM 19469]
MRQDFAAPRGIDTSDDRTDTEAREITPRALSPREKAAVIVRLLLSQGVSPGLDRLTPAQQAQLARTMAGLGNIDRATLAQVVRDFTGRLDHLALTFPAGLSDTLSLLDGHISPIARDGLRAEAELGDATDPWARLAAMEADRLRPLLERESAEVCAILLSKLGVSKAASLLADLPPDRAQVIAHAVALTATVTPEMVTRIGEHLFQQMTTTPQPAFRASPVDRVGAILNAVTASARDQLLEGLDERDAVFAAEVRRAIFTFLHIPKRVDPTDVPRILRRVEPDALNLALAAGLQAAPITVEFLLENMSKRMAEQLRDEAEATPTPREAEGEAAMAEIVAAIRALEEEGEIRLIPPED